MSEETKPEVGKPFEFEFAVSLEDLADCGGIDGLNNMMDEVFWDRFGEGMILSDISYEPVRIENGDIIIKVSAADVEGDE